MCNVIKFQIATINSLIAEGIGSLDFNYVSETELKFFRNAMAGQPQLRVCSQFIQQAGVICSAIVDVLNKRKDETEIVPIAVFLQIVNRLAMWHKNGTFVL